MESMDTESMDTGNMGSIKKNKKTAAKYRGKILKVTVTVLAAAILLLVFLFPEFPMKLLGLNKSEQNIVPNAVQGGGQALLRANQAERTFDGNGIFDPMESVEAFDIDGKDIRDRVSVTYVSGPSIAEKRIVYTVYDSNSDRLEASSSLVMKNYQGPTITIGNVGSVSWAELQNLTEVLVDKELLNAEDGFGNACPYKIAYYYEIDPKTRSAEITFSLSNEFQDYTSKKIKAFISEIPEQYFEIANAG